MTPSASATILTLTCPVCGEEFRRPRAWVRRVKSPSCSRRCNGRRRVKALAPHAHRGRAGWTESSLASYRQKMSGEKNPAWKGGVTLWKKKGNYPPIKYVRAPEWALPMARKDGYVMEHRLLMATMIGRLLTRAEVVHHRDHDPTNNEESNLELWPTNRDHKLAEHGHFVEGVANRASLAV